MKTEAMAIQARLSTFDTTMIVVSLVVGLGIFATPQLVAQGAKSPTVFFLAWLLGGVISLIGGLTFAEVGSTFSRPGAYYQAVAESYNPQLAFMLNWAGIFVVNAASGAGGALIGAGYFNNLVLPATWNSPLTKNGTAIVFILAVYCINRLGIKAGARFLNVLTLTKVAMIVILVAVAFHHLAGSGGLGDLFTSVGGVALMGGGGEETSWLGALGAALIFVQFTYGGYQQTINFGGDVRGASKTLPLAISLGMGIVLVLYLAINAAYYGVLGMEGIAACPEVAARVAAICLGPTGKAVFSVAIVISILAFLSVYMMNSPRTYYAMAKDRVLPGIFMRVNPRTQVQEFGLLFHCLLMIVSLLMLQTFGNIVSYVVFIDALSIAVTASTVFVIRRGHRGQAVRGYRMPGYPWLPAILVIGLSAISLYIFLTRIKLALIGLAFFVGGYPVFLLMRKLTADSQSGAMAEEDPSTLQG